MPVVENRAVDTYLDILRGKEMLFYPDWDDWLTVPSPYPEVAFEKKRVFTRFHRNGYDWDINGQVYTPEKEVDPGVAWVVTLGTNGSEGECDRTPDGRPGIAALLAARGVKVMTFTYPGHYHPPDGIWPMPVADRRPIFLYDKELSAEETADRERKCTFDTNLQGVGALLDAHLAGRRLVFTNGPLHGGIQAFSTKTTVAGLTSMGFAGNDGWRLKWAEQLGGEDPFIWHWPVDGVQTKSIDSHKKSGYESDRMLTPWGGAEEFIEIVSDYRSQLKPSLTVNQHDAAIPELEEFVTRTGLPRGEYFDFLDRPAPADLAGQGILIFVGMHDKKRWIVGELENKWEVFMARQYEKHTARTHMIPVPHHGHYAMAELHNEIFVHHFLWAHKDGYFAG